MAKFKAYEKYAYSEYFKTELPAEWMEKRLSYISAYDRNSFVDGPFGSDLKSSDYKESGVPLIQLNNIRDGKHVLQNYKFITEKKRVELSRHVALPNDIVIAKMAEPVARSAIVSDKYPEYVIVADCVKLSPDLSLINLSFLNWAINSDLVKMNAELVSSGTTRIRVSLGELKKLKIPYPSLIEQKLIANFLDHETAQIDTLIDKQQTLIQLLKEKRQAVISHAVTKGLNPDAPMKDSGVEWLGEVPEHWSITRIKYVAELTPSKSGILSRLEERCNFIPMEKLKLDTLVLDETRQIKDVYQGYTYFEDGDVLIAKVTPCFENQNMAIAANLVNGIGFGSSEIYVLRTEAEGLNQLLLYRLQESVFMQLGAGAMTGAGGLRRVPSDFLNNFQFGLPPISEQQEIVEHIEKMKSKFNDLIDNAQQAIQLMQERRTALISAAVTGKIDVRGWRASE